MAGSGPFGERAGASVTPPLRIHVGRGRAPASGVAAGVHDANEDLLAHAKHSRDHVLPAMAEVRKFGDKLETLVADDLWPLPTYRELLFIK